ncbi:hypothetical protein GWK47_030491 [Chionoecetes opilio]|uniref:Uncharacterized protein n=1 Tax=Chionoecetes opilio TaxID=41210 RepID=A0A8J4YRR0_CHIOP|nr:hypothetical protein GWK47_030491 [Chionoecetes opilio]
MCPGRMCIHDYFRCYFQRWEASPAELHQEEETSFLKVMPTLPQLATAATPAYEEEEEEPLEEGEEEQQHGNRAQTRQGKNKAVLLASEARPPPGVSPDTRSQDLGSMMPTDVPDTLVNLPRDPSPYAQTSQATVPT